MDKETCRSLLSSRLIKTVEGDRRIRSAFLLVHSDRLGLHLDTAQGTCGGVPAVPDQPYYVASVGKLFTSILIAILSEQGLLSFEDPIARFLDDELINGLHTYKGKDYSRDIKVKQLLNHTSGLHDYFEDKPRHGKPMIEILLDEPSRFWTPREVVRWSKENLHSHFPPGCGFHYSDTGYHLLGLIIEEITGRPLHEALHSRIFHPLGMVHSCLWQHSHPEERSKYPAADLFVGEKNVIDYRSLSIDYAGGGIVSTSGDLLKFMEALAHHRIIRINTFEKMKDWARFFPGIDYGYGLMNIRSVPILMPAKYISWGIAGSVGSFMFYHPSLDLFLIGTLNRFRYHRKGIKLMFKCIDILSEFANGTSPL